jgi:hypothetical protein
MLSSLLTAGGLGLLLGLRHAFEPDHLAAVSTLATRHDRLREGARLGLAWGLGHTATVGAVALLVVATGLHVPPAFSAAAELLVAALLVLLGLPVIARYARGRWHMHVHAHGGTAHLHLHSHAADASHGHAHPAWDARRSLGLGLAHGLAGSAAVVVILVAAAPTAGAQVAYLAGFGGGSTLAMLIVSLALAAAVRAVQSAGGRGGARLATLLHVGAAGASVAAGLVLAGRTMGEWLLR